MEALEWDALRNGSFLPTLSPAVPPYVKLGLTVAYTVFYSLLFLFIYIQLWLVLHYRHKRFSYQTVFLFLCLLWASLRTVLFSFYFKDFVAANSLSPFAFWLLYCFPVCLQFFTLTLMNLYFTQVRGGTDGRMFPRSDGRTGAVLRQHRTAAMCEYLTLDNVRRVHMLIRTPVYRSYGGFWPVKVDIWRRSPNL